MHYRPLLIVPNLTFALASFTKNVVREQPQSYDADLTNFVTRPEIKVPILDVTAHQPERIAPGHFFVAPYGRYYQEAFPTSWYQPCQTGPTIYDGKGDLVWTGACVYSNQNTADFRPNYYNGTWHLSAVHTGLDAEAGWNVGRGSSNGHGFVLDSSYLEESIVKAPVAADNFIPREFLITRDGQTAISILSKVEYVDISMVREIERDGGWVVNMGFREVDIATGETRFEWWALDHIPLTESTVESGGVASSLGNAWDFFDLSSVDKSDQGDYLLSSWQTSTIYSISARDGSINWRLGGKHSTFTHDFAIEAQRDVRFLPPTQVPSLSSSEENDEETEHLSMVAHLTNPSPNGPADTTPIPSALIISLSHTTNTARILRQIPRPDVTHTLAHGNAQHLPGPHGNVLVSLGGDAAVTEHLTTDGSTVLSARFRSDRFVTYRVYKSEFAAFPDEREMAVECAAYGVSEAKATTVCYVSWNGATEVRRWRFRRAATAGTEEGRGQGGVIVGTVERTGFESRIMKRGYIPFVRVEGLDGEGTVLGASKVVEVRVMQPWPQQSSSAGRQMGKVDLR